MGPNVREGVKDHMTVLRSMICILNSNPSNLGF